MSSSFFDSPKKSSRTVHAGTLAGKLAGPLAGNLPGQCLLALSLVSLVYLVFLIFIILILILIFVDVSTQAAGVSVFLKIFSKLGDLSVFGVQGLPSVLSFLPDGGDEPV